MRRTLGIDLGTTNSVAACNAQVLPLLEGDEHVSLMPSVVSFLPNGGASLGAEARVRRPIDPKNTIYSSKRLMGESIHSPSTRLFREQYPHDISATSDGTVQFETRAGAVRPSDVAALLTSHLCMRAMFHPAEVPTVVTVPSAFRDRAREDTIVGMLQAGFTEVRLIEEPVATAIAYLHRSSLRYAAVYDLGGGTFDFAVMDCERFPFRVLGHGGDPYLGGDDVDRSSGWDLRSEPATFARLTLACETAKCQLAEQESVELEIAPIDPAAPPKLSRVVLDRALLESAAVPLIRTTFGICDEVLSAASLHARDIQAVFLAGGSTRLPMLHDMVTGYFGRKLRNDLNPEHVVALGASLAAARPELWPLLDRR
jgi:molecular chaperone DnaK (HSP70)